MGFRTGAYAKVWKVEPKNQTLTSLKISISRKDKMTGEYVSDFGGFVSAVGSVAASKAASLKEGDRIKLGDVDVTNKYDPEKKVLYTNCKIFSFEKEGGNEIPQDVMGFVNVDSNAVEGEGMPF